MRPSFHPGDDPYLYVQQLAAWQRLDASDMAFSGDAKGTLDVEAMRSWRDYIAETGRRITPQ
jgi:hypothetical protein